jgi:hypothetical protein
MKPAKWLVLPLLLLIAALIFMRQKGDKPDVAPPNSETSASSIERRAEVPAIESATATRAPVFSAGPALASDDIEKLPDELEYGHHLQVIVQNENGQPLEAASVRTAFRAEQRQPSLTNLSRTFVTGAQGVADVRWPTQQLAYVEMLVSKDEYSPRKMMWDLKAGDEVPPSYTVKLKGSIRMGGLVVDPEGNPVSEATVSLARFWPGGEQIRRQGEEVTFPTQKHTTDAEGRWTARNVPPELLDRIFVNADHTNFIAVQVSTENKPEIEQELRAGTYKLQLQRGLEARGRVINEQQQPIAGADVWAGRKYSRERKETKTDEQGRFSFRNIKAGSLDFSASAEGYAPDVKSHNVGTNAEEIVLQLGKGSIIRGRVQDESSQPIEGVRVVLEGSPPDPSYDAYAFSTTTDREGKFEWRSAPNKPMPFYIGKTGYEQRRGVRLKPDEDNVITLRLTRQVKGQVLDSETQKPVTRFSIALGRHYGEKQFYADSYASKEFRNDQGLFTIEIHEENQNGIQATALGYAEQIQVLPVAESGEVKVVFKLKPSPALVGTVIGPDGNPVSGANVALVDGGPGGRNVQFNKGRLRNQGSRTRMVTTDAAGRFEIASPPEDGTVVAADGVTYGTASVAEVKAAGVVKLQRFGRIEGVMLQGVSPAAGQEVLLTSPPGMGMYFDFDSSKQTSDAQGRFTFENVPAGTVSIVRLVRNSSRSWMHSHRKDVTVTAGETTAVVLGGTDATLQGRARFETPPADTDFIMTAHLNTVPPKIPPDISPAERQALTSTPEWREEIKNAKHYSAVVGKDGAVLLDSIAPGQYTLSVTAVKGNSAPDTPPFAQGQITVTVPPEAHPGAPIQLSEIVLRQSTPQQR